MFSFFSFSRSKGHYPNPNRGGAYYKKSGIFGSGSFGSGSFSGSRRGYYDYPHAQQPQPMPQQAPQPQQAPVICPNCNTAVPSGSKFCLSCGAKINTAVFCPQCGKQLPPGAKFCMECGAKIG